MSITRPALLRNVRQRGGQREGCSRPAAARQQTAARDCRAVDSMAGAWLDGRKHVVAGAAEVLQGHANVGFAITGARRGAGRACQRGGGGNTGARSRNTSAARTQGLGPSGAGLDPRHSS